MAKVCVVGAGSIGGIVAARMAKAGHEVAAIARGEHLQAIRARGLELIDDSARLRDPQAASLRTRVQVAASDDPADFGEQDLVVIGLKAPAIAPMLPRLRSLVGPSTLVVPAINGVPWWYFHRERTARAGQAIRCLDPAGTMFRDLDPARIVGCVVYAAAEIAAPGSVRLTAPGEMVIGEPSGERSERLARLAAWWNESGIPARVADDIRLEIWVKLIGNLSFNPVAALTGYRADEIVADEALLDVIRSMIDESRDVARALGVPLAVGADERIAMARSIGRARASTLQDFEGGRRPELEALLDAVIELGAAEGVDVRTIRHVAALARARARQLGILPREPDAGDPAALAAT